MGPSKSSQNNSHINKMMTNVLLCALQGSLTVCRELGHVTRLCHPFESRASIFVYFCCPRDLWTSRDRIFDC